MKLYTKPILSVISIYSIPVKTQATAGGQFTLTTDGQFCADCCNQAGDQNFNGWAIGPIQEGASIQVNVFASNTAGEDTDFILQILGPNPANTDLTGCIDSSGVDGSETANFVAPETGTYEIHIHSKDSIFDANASYTLQITGNQIQPTTFTLASVQECPDNGGNGISCPEGSIE
jgi:hypothetical protein